MRRKRFFLDGLALWLAITLAMGPFVGYANAQVASPSNSSVKNAGQTVTEDFSISIGEIVKALATGALGMVGHTTMGLILNLLGWGSEDYTDDFNSMNRKLDEIEQTLTVIESQLKGLFKALKITEDEILANTNNPTAALNEIYTYNQALMEKTEGKKPGDGNKKEIRKFAKEIAGDLRIENDVNAIYHAILPQASPVVPVLNNYTDLCNLRLSPDDVKNNIKNKNLYTAYLGLEKYTTQLISQQLQGVNLVVEADNVLTPPTLADQGSDSPASQYMSDYKKQLHEEIANPKNGCSFIYNAWRLVLSWVDLTQWNTSMLPPGTQEITARAEFYRRSATITPGTNGKTNLGAYVVVFSTKDINQANIYLEDGAQNYYHPRSVKKYSIPGKVYDRWSGRDVRAESLYDVYVYNFKSLPPGDYFAAAFGGPVLGTLKVQRYKPDFTPDTDGDYTFGLLVAGQRIANPFGPTSKNWGYNISEPFENIKTFSSGAFGLPIGLPNGLKGYVSQDRDGSYPYDGHLYLNARFRYEGDEKERITVYYSVKTSGYNEAYENAQYGAAQSYSETRVYVWDHTRNDYVKEDCSDDTRDKHSSIGEGKKEFTKTLKGHCAFTAEPGHEYFLVVNMGVWCGNTNLDTQKSVLQVDQVDYVRLEFD